MFICLQLVEKHISFYGKISAEFYDTIVDTTFANEHRVFYAVNARECGRNAGKFVCEFRAPVDTTYMKSLRRVHIILVPWQSRFHWRWNNFIKSRDDLALFVKLVAWVFIFVFTDQWTRIVAFLFWILEITIMINFTNCKNFLMKNEIIFFFFFDNKNI